MNEVVEPLVELPVEPPVEPSAPPSWVVDLYSEMMLQGHSEKDDLIPMNKWISRIRVFATDIGSMTRTVDIRRGFLALAAVCVSAAESFERRQSAIDKANEEWQAKREAKREPESDA